MKIKKNKKTVSNSKNNKTGKNAFDLKAIFKNKKSRLAAALGLTALLAALALALLLPGRAAAPAEELEAQAPAPVLEQPEKQEEENFAPFVSAELKATHEKNGEVIGWLTLEGCEIDEAVVQGPDNDKYLRRTIESSDYDVWGCYFLDYINIIDRQAVYDRVTIIYGHSLEDYSESERFSKLKRYKDSAFAAENPEISFALLEKELKWEVFSACDIPISIDYIDPNPDDEKIRATLDYMLENSAYDFGAEPALTDKILVLSTCTSDENIRFIVAARLETA
ncbi:MAG: class B sortase [Oscillospiraceae bacterium]|nr:class B sortase [Oscillospiraceae bacterium]